LIDNPVGIMIFVGEKYLELADPGLGTATLEDEQFCNDICTTLSLYFFTPPSIMTSKPLSMLSITCEYLLNAPGMLCYYNNVRHEEYTEFNARPENLIRVPLGVSTFPYDAFPAPRAGVETTCTDLKFFKGMSSSPWGFLHLPMRLTFSQSAATNSFARSRSWWSLRVYGVSKGDGC
jgi:hypothetical protein